MTEERIGVLLDGAIGRIEIRRPEKKNAIDTSMAGRIEDGLGELSADESCKVVVISGQGGDLSSGADLGERRSDTAEPTEPRRSHSTMLRALANSRLPIVALVDGWAIGMGLGILGAATYAVAGKGSRFMLPETKYGYIPYAVVPYLTPRVAPETVMLWSLSAAPIALDEAVANHLITHGSETESAAAVAAPILDSLVAMPRELVEDGVEFVHRYRLATLFSFVDWCEIKMAEVVEEMRSRTDA